MKRSRITIWPDFWILGTVLLLLGISLLTLYSATNRAQGLGFVEASYCMRQSFWMSVGLALMLFVGYSDYRKIGMASWLFYAIGLSLLVLVLLVGKNISGAQRWLQFAGITIQPSELAKTVVIVALAWYLEDVKQEFLGLKDIVASGLIVLVPMLLIMKQPDLGTSLVMVPIFLSILFAAGLSIKWFVGMIAGGVLCSPLAWFMLKGYQRQRILTFLNPYDDQFGAGWPIIQSRIAIGSGKFSGKGYLHGTQTQLDFLPERHTDFIFSVIGEEWGFIGSFVIFALFFVLASRIIAIGLQSRDRFGELLCAGVASMIMFQVLVNIGMTFGFFPVTGLPLPFISYGGSSLVSTLLGIGLVMSVSRQT